MKGKKSVILFVIIVCLISYLFYAWFGKKELSSTQTKEYLTNKTSPTTMLQPTTIVYETQSSLFVPYWALGQEDLSSIPYEKIYYFGVAPSENGINKQDMGYINLERFNCPDEKKCILVFRMLNDDLTKIILSSTKNQKDIIKELRLLLEEYSFEGIALNLEYSGLFNNDIKTHINDFVSLFSTSLKKDYKTFSFIVYGDMYYRRRPWEMKKIGALSDEVMIMAYDFHKSYGEPGPNFPFGNFEKWGYDFRTMVFDFSSDVPKDKLTIIFGMYGYDWTLNGQGLPLKRAEAVTLNQISNLKTQNHNLKFTGTKSREQMITYEDEDGFSHVVWYEDEGSVRVKEEFLMQQGIGSVSYWAYSYF